MVTSQTIYSEHLNLVLSCMISPAVETCSIWFGFLIADSGGGVLAVISTAGALVVVTF